MIPKIILCTLIAGFGLLSSCNTYKHAYPLKTCIVSDNELGSMGDPISLNHLGQEVKFCCKPCVKKFTDNPEKYLQKLKLTTSTPNKL